MPTGNSTSESEIDHIEVGTVEHDDPERGERYQRTFHPAEELAAELEESDVEPEAYHECTC